MTKRIFHAAAILSLILTAVSVSAVPQIWKNRHPAAGRVQRLDPGSLRRAGYRRSANPGEVPALRPTPLPSIPKAIPDRQEIQEQEHCKIRLLQLNPAAPIEAGL